MGTISAELAYILAALAVLLVLAAFGLLVMARRMDRRFPAGPRENGAKRSSSGGDTAELEREVAVLATRLWETRRHARIRTMKETTSNVLPCLTLPTSGYGRPVARGIDSRRSCVAADGDRVCYDASAPVAAQEV